MKVKAGRVYISKRTGEKYLVTAVGKRYALVEILSANGGTHEFARKLFEFNHYKLVRGSR